MNDSENKITVENFDVDKYSEQLAGLLDKIQNDCWTEYYCVSQQIYEKWNCDLFDIFDRVTGGIFVKDYECYILNSFLSELFTEKQNDSFVYSCPLDNGLLLRGPIVYYYLICFKVKHQNPTVESVAVWWGNINNFIGKLKSALESDSKIDITERQAIIQTKYLLGCLDNLRSFTLVCMNSEAVLMSDEEGDFIKIKGNMSLENNYKVLGEIHALINSLIFEECDIPAIYTDLLQVTSKVEESVNLTFGKLMNHADENINGRCLKLHREADSYIENYVTLNYAYKQIEEELRNSRKHTYICGLLNGAVEILVMMHNLAKGDNLEPAYLIVPGDYLTRHKESSSILWNGVEYEHSSYLVDDNVMTGSTIKAAMKYMNEQINSTVNKCILIRHPDINRISQMKAYNEAISVDFLEKHCVGILNESPYTKIKPNTNICGEYLDELGIFTLTGDYFLRFLYKNGLYGVQSEVYFFEKMYNLDEVR